MTKLSISLLLPEKVTSGSPLAGSLIVANTSDRAITIVGPDYHSALNLIVFDRNWDQVSPDSAVKVHVAYAPLKIAPGKSATFPLHEIAFTTGTARVRFTLGQGRYYIAAIYHPPPERLPTERPYPLVAVSEVRRLLVVSS